MSIKEGLLREYLGELFPERYQSVVQFPNENANVNDEFGKISICCGCGITYKIKEFDDGQETLTKEQIERIADVITSNHKEQKTLCKVNCEEIIEDYALLMAAIEESAEGKYSSVEELKNIENEVDEEVQEVRGKDNKMTEHLTKCDATKNKNISNVVTVVVGGLVTFGLGMIAKAIVSRR
jgi:hypothetical protein